MSATKGAIYAFESADDGATWQKLCKIDFPEGLGKSNMHLVKSDLAISLKGRHHILTLKVHPGIHSVYHSRIQKTQK